MLILRRQNQRFETLIQNADPKRRYFRLLFEPQVNRKGVYVTSCKRGCNVILRSYLQQKQRLALTTIVNAHFWAAFMLILRRRFQMRWFKRRSKTPFTEVLFHASLEKKTIRLPKKACLRILECLIQAIVRAQVNRKGVYMTSFKRGYNVILCSCFHQNQRFALTTFIKAHFWASRIGVLKRVYSKISMDATAFCSNHVWKRWFWPQKLSINAPRFWIGVLKRVYSKISMDATAWCFNHVWKRWFWRQKFKHNAP